MNIAELSRKILKLKNKTVQSVSLLITYHLSLLAVCGALVLFFCQCKTDSNKSVIPKISVAPINAPVIRFEQALFKLDTLKLSAEVADLQKRYPNICNVYFEKIMAGKTPHQFFKELPGFLSDKEVRRVNDTIQNIFKDFTPYQNEINAGFGYYKHYFPTRPIPQVFTFFSMYAYGITPPSDSTMGIGLDFFLGENHYAYNFIENLRFQYIRRTLTPAHLSKTFFERLIIDISQALREQRLLDQMLVNGKTQYILEALLPNTPDSIRWAYTQKQFDWTRDNEQRIWAQILKENLLYSTEIQKISKLVNPSPNASGMPPEAPGRIANYIGYKIIASYMNRHPETTFEQLLKLGDAQKILEEAKYKPE